MQPKKPIAWRRRAAARNVVWASGFVGQPGVRLWNPTPEERAEMAAVVAASKELCEHPFWGNAGFFRGAGKSLLAPFGDQPQAPYPAVE